MPDIEDFEFDDELFNNFLSQLVQLLPPRPGGTFATPDKELVEALGRFLVFCTTLYEMPLTDVQKWFAEIHEELTAQGPPRSLSLINGGKENKDA